MAANTREAAKAAADQRVAAFQRERDEAAAARERPADFDQAGFDQLRARAKARRTAAPGSVVAVARYEVTVPRSSQHPAAPAAGGPLAEPAPDTLTSQSAPPPATRARA